MRVDDTAVSQDDSGLLHAGRVIAYANSQDKAVNTVGFGEFDDWIQENELDWGVSSKQEFGELKSDIVDGSYDVDEIRDVYSKLDSEPDIGEDPEIDKDFSVDIYRVLPEDGESGEDFGGNMLGFAVDFPNSDVYVEWNNKIFPDPLKDGHVSIYSSLEDLETATNNQTELVDTVTEPDTVEKSSVEKQMVEGYPDLPLDDTPEEVVNWLHRLDADYNPSNESEALLYQLLGSGTPEWKMSKEDADYKDEPEGGAYCGNCEYAYYSNQSGRFICSKIRGKVDWEGWCRLWDHAEPDPLLEEEFGVPDGVDKSLEKAEHLEDVVIGGQTLTIEVADDDASRYTGLSKYDSLGNIDGMLFKYPREEPHELVWRDMSFPIDVIHLDKDNRVVKTGSITDPDDSVQAVSKNALELPLGFVEVNGIEKGDKLELADSISKGSEGSDNRFEKFIGSSYHRARKVQQQGEQLSPECFECLSRAFREQVWPDELQKSPSWASNDDVDEETAQWVSSIMELEDPMWDEYENVPMAAGLTVKQEIKESLTQPQGWSLDSIANRLGDDFPHMEEHQRNRIARQEVAGVLNRSKIASLLARPDDPLVRWVGPDDGDTTELCKSLVEETSDGVPISEMLSLLKDHAKQHDGGTPERAEQGLVHWLCRHTVELVDN